MNELLSFFGVIALWIAVSYAGWWLFQRRKGAGERHLIALARQAEMKVAEAQGVFDHIRNGTPRGRSTTLTQETHALLKRIQERGAYFDDVNSLRPRIARALGEECEPLAEILHIRRDLWAASEILLIEDLSALTPDLAGEGEYDRLREEAVGLLFRDSAAGEDLINLRLSLARDDAAKFVAGVQEMHQLLREKERLPTAAEVIAYPVAAARAAPGYVRSARDQLASIWAQAKTAAVAIQNSEPVVRGLGELTRARQELPQRVVLGLDKASSTARQGAASVKGHYDFLVRAYDFQAKYEEVLRKAPELTERGKQFIARLELAEKSERLKLTSATVRDAARRMLVRGLGHAIAGLQRLQIALDAQLAQRGVGKDAPSRGTAGHRPPEMPLSGPTDETPARPKWVLSAPSTPRRFASASNRAQRSPEAESESLADTARGVTPVKPKAVRRAKPEPVVLKPSPALKSVNPNAFDAVMAWYKPAMEPKPVAESKVTVPEIPIASPAPAAPPVDAAAVRKAGWLRKLLGGGKTAAPIVQVVTASFPVTPAPAKAAAKPAKKTTKPPAAPPASSKPGLAAKLTDVSAADSTAEEPELLMAETEEEDPGELTRSILEGRDPKEEKPGRNRAFPWLRR
jgi:hypothetical protein